MSSEPLTFSGERPTRSRYCTFSLFVFFSCPFSDTRFAHTHILRFVQSDTAKYVKEPAAIDFSAYKKKLKFTSSAVDALEVRSITSLSRHR